MNRKITEPIHPRGSHQAPAQVDPTAIDAGSPTPLYRQIYDSLRRQILDRSLHPGQRLVSSRAMAQRLEVSRNTVLEAVEQLIAEGYLIGRVGSGTFVTDQVPEELMGRLKLTGTQSAVAEASAAPDLSERGQGYRRWARIAEQDRSIPFQLGRPAVDEFPWKTWWRLMNRHGREPSEHWLDYADSVGYLPLRQALARHLRGSRGLECAPEQIVIVRGSQQGIDLAARVLLDAGDAAWIEDPGYGAAEVVLEAGGARLVSVPLDEEGLDVEAGRRLAPDARLAYVTPSHQYPLGITMSLARRLQLLDWARGAGSWIIEDDYDSEYRYAGRPLASLAGLDRSRHVIYLGTLSKVLFPALRLGYLVVPPEHVDAFAGARYASDRHTFILEQAVVADFFDGGHFDRHIRRMRLLYAERQEALDGAVGRHLSGLIDLRCSTTGLHDVGWLRGDLDDSDIARRARNAGVNVTPLSSYCRRAQLPPALLFGYAGFPKEALRGAVERLAQALA